MLTIHRISTTVFRLPMHGSLQWGKHSALSTAQGVLVEVELSDGSVGYAEAPPRPTIYGETIYSITSIIEHELATRVIDMAVDDYLVSGMDALHQIKNNHTAKGAVDIAVYDAAANSRGITLAEMLGTEKERARVSYILGIGTLDEVLEEAQNVFEQGVRVLKVKVGRNWQEDIARIEALQEVFGNDMRLYADANETIPMEEAPAKLSQLTEMGLLYCEEPLPVELIKERAALREGEYIPIIADDSTFTARDLSRELAMNTFDVLNIKTARTGYTDSRRMLDAVLRAGKSAMVGSQASAGLGTARAAVFAALSGVEHPSELSFPLKLKEDIISEPIPIKEGWMYVTDALQARIDPTLLKEAVVK